ncbi:MAG: internalin, putative [uncultured Aureispira sp.]|uniref:Internalin, putative n=1 Tax=uncultured Aureispira sp. TaxID=1331704 RepID=A0A6S6UL01_9BACT|nr:MAG: internalin, putative [uncultured Aureispira sp.]
MKLLFKILVLLSCSFFYAELRAQCAVTTNVASNFSGQDLSCFGSCDGLLTASASGGTTPYTYLWNNGALGDSITGICAGTYAVTITDAVGCTATDNIIVTQPSAIVATITNVTNTFCFGSCTGSATIIGSGGSAPYTYLWGPGTGFQTTSTVTNLCTGTYSVTVTDMNGCVTSNAVSIAQPSSFNTVISSFTNPSSPNATDGSATAIATGGTAPYTYTWATGATTASINNLGAGTYCVSITDANGCSSASCITLLDNVTLIGVVRQDTNHNCIADSTEPLVAYQIIKTTNNSTGNVRYFTTNYDGAYSADLDTGNYTLEFIPINAPYGNSCTTTQSLSLNALNPIDTLDWTVESLVPCHLMTVSMSAPFLRRAGGGSAYSVYYCNNGSSTAYNSYVDVEIDSFLTVLNTSVPIASQTGNLYRFNLDTVDVGECGSIYINVVVNATAIPGQTHCSQAHIYPDSFCLPLWSGSILDASSQCQNDTILFKIKNIGNSMLVANNYNIFEDDIIIQMAPFNLNAGDSIEIIQLADSGKTYRIQANQASGFPAILGPVVAHSSIEGCLPFSSGLFNTGFLTQYYTGNSTPFIDIDCQQSIASFDPNDKAAQPAGYGSPHYIDANTPLNYKIRFQNTGTDTAFTIVIIDTLSSNLNPASLQMGASSHPYTWALSGAGILTVNFEDILLVDSIANEPLSHGFFTYTIDQVTNLTNGSTINNQAAIYFDFNPPIFTNTTLHTIGENYIPIVLDMTEAWVEEMQVHLYPNPTAGLVYLEQLEAKELQIKVFDNLGRIVLQEKSNDRQATLDLSQLAQGMYYINIQQDKKVSTHKVVKH